MMRVRFDDARSEGLSLAVREADIVEICDSNSGTVYWHWNKRPGKSPGIGEPAATVQVLEIAVGSNEQLGEATALVEEIKG